MSDKKYTPGPWRAWIADDYKNEVGIFAGRWIIADMAETIPDCEYSEEEKYANANLIAAAPELLEALEEFVSWAERMAKWDKCGDSYYMAKSAIRKAKGKGK